MKLVKFGEDRNMYSEVTAVFVQYTVLWWNIKIRRPTTTTTFNDNAQFT